MKIRVPVTHQAQAFLSLQSGSSTRAFARHSQPMQEEEHRRAGLLLGTATRPPPRPPLLCKEMFIFFVSFRLGTENSQVMYREFYPRASPRVKSGDEIFSVAHPFPMTWDNDMGQSNR